MKKNNTASPEIKLPNPLQLIDNMRGDLMAARMANTQVVVEGPALDALLTVVEVAKRATEMRLVMSVPENNRLTICVDFDGTLHSYTSGWKGVTETPDPPVEGAIDWLREMIYYREDGDRRFNVAIYSSRSREPGGIEAMQNWLVQHGLEKQDALLLSFPETKPATFLTLDDRAICFEGTFPKPGDVIAFKPWNERC